MKLGSFFLVAIFFLPLSCVAGNGKNKDEEVGTGLSEIIGDQIDPSWKIQIEPYTGVVDREKNSAPFKWNDKHRIKIGGKQWLQITVQSNRQGYLYLISKPESSSEFDVIYPIKRDDTANLVSPGVPFIIPRRWPALGNNGKPEKNNIYAVLAQMPLESFSSFFGSNNIMHAKKPLQPTSVKSPCKALGGGVDTCGAISPTKRLGEGVSTEKHDANKFGIGKLILEEY